MLKICSLRIMMHLESAVAEHEEPRSSVRFPLLERKAQAGVSGSSQSVRVCLQLHACFVGISLATAKAFTALVVMRRRGCDPSETAAIFGEQ